MITRERKEQKEIGDRKLDDERERQKRAKIEEIGKMRTDKRQERQ